MHSLIRFCLLTTLLCCAASCTSLWGQYQQRKIEYISQLATKQITKSTYDRRMAELERWYANGGRTYTRSRSSSSSTKKKAAETPAASESNSSTASSEPATSTADTPYPRSSGIDQIERKKKSGINEF